jgi:hypothetical protein
MRAKEFLPKNKSGMYSRNAVETLAESYAEYKLEHLHNDYVECVKENLLLRDLLKQAQMSVTDNHTLWKQIEITLNQNKDE